MGARHDICTKNLNRSWKAILQVKRTQGRYVSLKVWNDSLRRICREAIMPFARCPHRWLMSVLVIMMRSMSTTAHIFCLCDKVLKPKHST